MKNYDNEYDNGNEDGNKDKNSASRSGSDGTIFDLITMPWYHGGGLGDDSDGDTAAAQYISISFTIYLPYKYHIKMYHKLLFAEIGVLGLCC